MSKDKTINYIEFPVFDIEKTKSFYAAAFGWTFTDFGPDYCEFTDGQMKGGFETAGIVTAGGPLVVLYGNDLEALEAAIVAAGGKISRPIFPFPGGERFHFTDPNGHELGVWRARQAHA